MRLSVLLLLAIASTAVATSVGPIPESEASWEDMVAHIRTLNCVGGEACGAAAQPAKFFTLSQIMIPVGTQEQFRDLLKDNSPVVRCMGLLGLSQRGEPENAEAIRAYMTDRGLITYMPGGCSASTIPVGHFATSLLFADGRMLGYPGPFLPLLSEKGRMGLCLEILAADDAVIPQPQASRRLYESLRDGKTPMRLESLRELAPSLREFEIVKAVGRLPRSGRQRSFLIVCLNSNSLDAQSRLAAGSALTRYTDDISRQALQRNRDALNLMNERSWGDEFLSTSEAAKTHERAMRAFRPFALHGKTRRVAAVKNTHPLALGMLLEHPPGRLPNDPGFRDAWAGSLVAVSGRVKDVMQPWNTYADAAYELDLWLESARAVERDKTPDQIRLLRANWLTVEERREIERNVADALSKTMPAE